MLNNRGRTVPVAGTERDITIDEDQDRPVISSVEGPESESQHELAEAAESISTDGAHPIEELLQSDVATDGVQIEGSISLEAENKFAESSVMEQNAADSPQTEESVAVGGKEEPAFTGETADGSPVVVAQSSIVEGASAEESPIVGEESVITDESSVPGHDSTAAASVSLSELPADSIAIALAEEPNTPGEAPTPESVSAEELPAAQTVSDETHLTIESASAEEELTEESPSPEEHLEREPLVVENVQLKGRLLLEGLQSSNLFLLNNK
jgi:hypothetical protein